MTATTAQTTFTREAFSLTALKEGVGRFDGERVRVHLQGRSLTGELLLTVSGALRLVLDAGVTYFDQSAVDIFDPDFNNLTPHVLEQVCLTRG